MYAGGKMLPPMSDEPGGDGIRGPRYESQRALRRNSWMRRRLRAEDALEAFAVLKEDQYPQYRGHQSRSNARRRKRQMKRKDVVELRRQRCQRKWHEVARKQQQPTEQLNREEECGKMRLADSDKKLNRERIRRGRLVDEVEKSIQPKTVKISPSR